MMKNIFSLRKIKKSLSVLNTKAVLNLIKDYKFQKKIDMKCSYQGSETFTITQIIPEQGEVISIPGEFLRKFLVLKFGDKNPLNYSWDFFSIGPPLSLKSITEDVKRQELSQELALQVEG